MAVFMGAFPVLPGKEQEARKFGEETSSRLSEFEASQQRLGVTTETWMLQQSPEGSMVIVHFESDDVERALLRPSPNRTTASTSGSKDGSRRSLALISTSQAGRCPK